MKTYSILLYPQVINKDFKKLNKSILKALLEIIQKKLETNPLHYGIPLRKDLKNGRKLRIGDYRVLFEIEEKIIKIYRIDHRSVIYNKKPVKRNW